jgi:branched-subunit amino acid aminotransferase/4-amino-4-deoxychorismate lyase
VEQRDIRLEEVITAKEAFITSTTKGVLPVIEINGSRITKGVAGEATLLLRKQLQQLPYS